jgi:hypothetical protein
MKHIMNNTKNDSNVENYIAFIESVRSGDEAKFDEELEENDSSTTEEYDSE